MDDQNGFTLKQHIKFLVLSLLISVTGIYLDIHFENLGYHMEQISETTLPNSPEIIFCVQGSVHNEIVNIAI